MDAQKRRKLETAGWKVGDIDEFLGLSPQEVALIDMKIALMKKLREQRTDQQVTQQTPAAAVDASESGLTTMELGDPSVSLDVLIQSLLNLGLSAQDVGQVIAGC
ncbi:MAG: transcriptional regulator [Spirulinaceae cyanobacterium]